ncbi:entericidin A/B family lipoprotein [Franconibacter daqui]|uniref:Entericidin A/B family lipoprotein n=1 Tax=Franconibacter daqui TaxID=2047724 RepID=A0ABV1PR73_9ENTR|nr:entericidin A/B family lipoprotein [Franconibacter daqui]
MKPFISYLLLALFSGALLSGCNTARGIGEDVQQLGNAIERAAR